MTVDDIYTEFLSIGDDLNVRAKRARDTAIKARKSGNLKKWDKFNALARTYEHIYLDVMPLACELFDHTSEEFKDKTSDEIPF